MLARSHKLKLAREWLLQRACHNHRMAQYKLSFNLEGFYTLTLENLLSCDRFGVLCIGIPTRRWPAGDVRGSLERHEYFEQHSSRKQPGPMPLRPPMR